LLPLPVEPKSGGDGVRFKPHAFLADTDGGNPASGGELQDVSASRCNAASDDGGGDKRGGLFDWFGMWRDCFHASEYSPFRRAYKNAES
jgi:hypothetical protein